MSTELKGPEGSTHVQVEGVDYDADENGVFTVDNGEHVAFLKDRCGFLTPEEAADVSPLLTDRWPHIVHSLASEGITLVGVTTGDGLLDVVEARVAKFHQSIEEPELPVDPDAPVEEAPAAPEVPVDAEPAEVPVDAVHEVVDLGPNNLRPDPLAPAPVPGVPAGIVEEAPSEESQEADVTFQAEEPAEGAEDASAEGDASAPAASEAEPEAEPAGEPEAEPAGEEAPADPAEPAPEGEVAEEVAEPADAEEVAEPTAEEEPAPVAEVVDPTFNTMNRGQIHEWLVANGGTELHANAKKDDLIEAAELRVAELQRGAE